MHNGHYSHTFKKFQDELSCSLCKSFLQDPMITKECLHRFCAKCIQKEIANSLKHCPSCNHLFSKKVPLKSDPNFASIINKIILRPHEIVQNNVLEVMKLDGIDIDSYTKRNNRLIKASSSISEPEPNFFKRNFDVGNSTEEVRSKTTKKLEENCSLQARQNQSNYFLMEKQRLIKGSYIEMVLWPDASVFRLHDLPKRLRNPRYIYVPPESTVGHLTAYLVIRIELEENYDIRRKYVIQITNVEDERDEFTLLMRQSKNLEYLNMSDNNLTGDCTLVMRNNNDAPNIMLTVAHPFKPLSSELSITELLTKFCNTGRKRPLKVVYRFVKNQ